MEGSKPEKVWSVFGQLRPQSEVNVVEFIYGLVNDRTTTSRQQLRVYVIRDLWHLSGLCIFQRAKPIRGTGRKPFLVGPLLGDAFFSSGFGSMAPCLRINMRAGCSFFLFNPLVRSV